LRTQGVGLLFEEGVQGALRQPGGGGEGDLLRGGEIDIEPGPAVVACASGDDFAPLDGELADLVDVLGSEVTACHDASCLGVKTTAKGNGLPSEYDRGLDIAKLFMTSMTRVRSIQPGGISSTTARVYVPSLLRSAGTTPGRSTARLASTMPAVAPSASSAFSM
jgi:hypothetical protein